jgi:hypothetical protein
MRFETMKIITTCYFIFEAKLSQYTPKDASIAITTVLLNCNCTEEVTVTGKLT